jgi:hypothetical protein
LYGNDTLAAVYINFGAPVNWQAVEAIATVAGALFTLLGIIVAVIVGYYAFGQLTAQRDQLDHQRKEFARAYAERRRAQADRTVMLLNVRLYENGGQRTLAGSVGLENFSDLPVYDLSWDIRLNGQPWPFNGPIRPEGASPHLMAEERRAVNLNRLHVGDDLDVDDVTASVAFRDHSNNWWRRGVDGKLSEEPPPQRIKMPSIPSTSAVGMPTVAVAAPQPRPEAP